MPNVFDLLSEDHQEVKRMLAELETRPSVLPATSTNTHQLTLRKKTVEQLIIEVSKHEAVEEMYFWPAVREHHPDGNELADTAIGQEQEGKKVLDLLDKLDAGQPEFEDVLAHAAAPEELKVIEAEIKNAQGVDALLRLRTMHLGPDHLIVAAQVAFDDEISADQAEDVADEIDRRLSGQLPLVAHVFLDPTQAPSGSMPARLR